MTRAIATRSVSLLLVLLVVLAACGGESGTEATGPTTTASVATTKTELPPTTVTTTTTSVPAVSSTTSVAQVDVVPVATQMCLLGGVDGGDWVSYLGTYDPAGNPVPPEPIPFVGGEVYRIVAPDGVAEPPRTGSAPEPFCDPLPTETQVVFDPPLPGPLPFAGPPEEGEDRLSVLAVGGDWTPVPRPTVELSPNQSVYRDALAALLLGRGLPEASIDIDRIVRVDLEGDGVDEVIIEASNYPPGAPFSHAEEDQYSVVFVRKLIEDEVETAILADTIHTGEEFDIQVLHRLVTVADANGDGDMEIVVDGSHYEGYWTIIYDFVDVDLGFLPVLSCGCGA